ncbi:MULTISPECIES: hypothetical protein [unclassified Brevundimonas]|uniref:hypothetical protein n=1 Tax=unclassified Brevundimonas TaxID=2622653 RepID=UPI0025C60F43|nr:MULTISPECIES: hypothetical protein [unclassified Brevundimonas]
MTGRKPQERILHLRRYRSLPNDGSRTLYCVLSYSGGLFDHLSFVSPGQYPEFTGEEAWMRVHWWSKAKHKVVEQVADKTGKPMPSHGT